MDQHSKSELIRSYRKRYERSLKREKSQIISQIVDATGYCRKHVIRALNKDIDVPKRIHRKKTSRYAHLYDAFLKIWAAGNFVCGKSLQPFLPELLRSLIRHKEIKISKEDQALLVSASAATIDRLLAPARKQISLKGRSTTKPGTLLKHQTLSVPSQTGMILAPASSRSTWSLTAAMPPAASISTHST
jgi:hypothetical protein